MIETTLIILGAMLVVWVVCMQTFGDEGEDAVPTSVHKINWKGDENEW